MIPKQIQPRPLEPWYRWIPWLAAGLVLVGCDRATIPSDPGNRPIPLEQLQFVRLRKDAEQEYQSLDVSRVRFVSDSRSKSPILVDLVSAVHIADEAYYRDLNRRFRQYDAVLYELVAPEGTRIQPGQQGSSLVSILQRQMKQLLGLSFQLEAIDYTRRNMIHADLSPDEVRQRMQERGESWLGIMLGMMVESMKKSARNPWVNDEQRMLMALFSPDRETHLKQIMAEQMADLETMTTLFEGANGSTLITDRNQRAIDVLRRQLDKGTRNIAIFYGAGHMPDLAKRLVHDLDLVPVHEEWLQAWDLRAER